MPKKIDLTGRRFGNLVVIRQVDHIQYNCGRKQVAWECRCDCGNVKTVSGALLRRGDTTSCGCIQRKIARQNALYRNIKHGMSYTRLHVIWEGMKARCCNPNATGYDKYGGKGVSVCSDWLDFVNFAEWAKRSGYKKDLTIDRIDLNGNYCPSNCRWVTYKEQARNRSSNKYIHFCGEDMIYAKFIEITGIGWKKVKQGIESGLSGEEISQLYSKVKELGKDETIRQLSQTRRIQ